VTRTAVVVVMLGFRSSGAEGRGHPTRPALADRSLRIDLETEVLMAEVRRQVEVYRDHLHVLGREQPVVNLRAVDEHPEDDSGLARPALRQHEAEGGPEVVSGDDLPGQGVVA